MTTTTTRTDHRGIDDLLCERITRTLNEQHHGIDWLASETGISERVLRSRMAGTTSFGIAELGAVATALGCGWGTLVVIHEGGEQR